LTKAKSVIEEKFKPAPKVRPTEVSSPQPSAAQPAIPANIKDLIVRWSQSNDPVMQDSAKAMKLKYGIK
jgi:hypothetical protein